MPATLAFLALINVFGVRFGELLAALVALIPGISEAVLVLAVKKGWRYGVILADRVA